VTFVNLTPHAITLRVGDVDYVYPPSGTVCRVEMRTTPVGHTAIGDEGDYIPVFTDEVDEVVGLPPYKHGVKYLVSGLCLANIKGRTDVFAPATGPKDGAIRNDKGHVVAVTALKASA